MPRYEIIDGKRVETRPATKTHPEGNAPRDAKGNRLDRPAPKQAASATTKQPAKGGK